MWNYRLIKHFDEKEIWLGIHRVYYNNIRDKEITDFDPTPSGVKEIDKEGIQWIIDEMEKCMDKPMLYEINGELTILPLV